jgi:hypothetical protein
MCKIVTVNDRVPRGDRYDLVAPGGENCDPGFAPQLTPREMPALGMIVGKYITDCRKEFPKSWFRPTPSPAHVMMPL